MNILFVVGVFPTYSETFIVNQINDLIDRGHQIYVLSMYMGSASIAGSYANRHHLQERCIYQFNSNQLFGRIVSKAKRLLQLDHLLALKELKDVEQDIDIIHCHFGDNALLFSKIYLPKYFKRAKKICNFHGYDFMPFQTNHYSKYYESIMGSFDAFLYNTPYLGQIVTEVIPDYKCYELPVGFDQHFLDPFYKKKKTRSSGDHDFLNLVFCGRLIKLKGVLLLPIIAQLLVQSNMTNFRISIIGEGDQKEELVRVIGAYELEEYFKLYGSLGQEEVFDVMAQSDLFILPGVDEENTGLAETQGLVIQEAQFLGLPVLISTSGGAKFGMIDDVTGFVVEQGEVSAFAQKIMLLMSDKQKMTDFSKAAHDFALQNYTSAFLGERLVYIYKKLMN